MAKESRKENVINHNAFKSTKEGDEIECFIKLTIENPNEEVVRLTQSIDNIYEVTSFTLKRNKNSYDVLKSEFEIHYNDKTGSDFLEPPEVYIDICLVPETLSEYIWFQEVN